MSKWNVVNAIVYLSKFVGTQFTLTKVEHFLGLNILAVSVSCYYVVYITVKITAWPYKRERERERERAWANNNKLVFCSCAYIYGYHNIGVKIGIWYSGHTCKKGLYISPIYRGF